ncbi:MAG: PAS domain S-box protein [Bacteroidetes bacterium]|nr:PAS domain S-box protein [Bacteroidota bacterium]
MLTIRKRIETILIYSLFSAMVGGLVIFLILLFSSYLYEQTVLLQRIKQLYQENSVFYLLNVLPVLFGMAGGLYGNYTYNRGLEYSRIIHQQTSNIQRIVAFAKEIGKGNLGTRFESVNGEHILESTLEDMRKDLTAANQEEFERNEIISMVGKVSEILTSNNEIDKLSEEIIYFLVGKLEGVVQGAFYVVEDIEEEESIIQMTACYAYNRKKNLTGKFRFAQGLVGQAAVEKSIIVRTEIPEDYVTITSGLLGEKKPGSIVITPLITNDKVYGVIELASFQKFTPLQIRMLEETSETIARTIFNVEVSEKTYILLQESRQMGKELAIQKQQLLLNAEETIVAQEELRKSNLKLGHQIQEVHRGNKKTQILLENASEVITIFSKEGEVSYVSPSINNIMGYFPEEIIGQKDAENVHPQDAAAFTDMLNKLLSFPEEMQTLQYRYFTKSGEIIWMEAAGKNFVSDPLIAGMVVTSRDISAQRLAAKEQRMRAKMQALSENSPDIIIRIDIFSRCIYINPVIESYTGLKQESFLRKPISDVGIDPQIIAFWKEMLSAVSVEGQKIDDEMIFPTPQGDKTLQVNAIPEFNENNDIESVLIVSHDITEAKKREELIQMKNKSIGDSINYAYNIQSSLMPTESMLRKFLPNSFMVFLPKDVVSGDYPWLFKEKGDLYIGAMDCTGHGVPGALMSLIGYFLQNQVIQKNKNLDAGQFLDQLHAVIVETLRQEDENSVTNDGMDAAFCKINLKTKELQYAGAHRPLYHVRKGELMEVKGDKCPVGSSQYKNRKPFTNHTIKLQTGDSVYFMTDGFADQYGGPGGKQKYMVGRAKNLIRENTHLSIFQMGDLFKETLMNWKGDTKQLDDVLITGIKF